jgi:hypothetical protein
MDEDTTMQKCNIRAYASLLGNTLRRFTSIRSYYSTFRMISLAWLAAVVLAGIALVAYFNFRDGAKGSGSPARTQALP